MTEEHDALRIEGHVVRLVQMGRSIASKIRSSDLAANSRQGALLDRCLGRLSDGQPLDARDAGGFQTVLGILRRELDAETCGTAREFLGVHDPEAGDVGAVIDRRLLTERGEELASLLHAFEQFMEARQALLDRLRVENVLARAIRD